MTTDRTDARETAVKRLTARRDLCMHAVVYVAFNGALVLVWYLTGHGRVPSPMANDGLGLFAHGYCDRRGRGQRAAAGAGRDPHRRRSRDAHAARRLEVPANLGLRTSMHEIGLADVLALLRLRGSEPAGVVVLGGEPATTGLREVSGCTR